MQFHKLALTILLLFTADKVQESIPVQQKSEVAAAMKRDKLKCNLTAIWN